MKNSTTELLDCLARSIEEGSIVSDYRLAKEYFRLPPQRVSKWRTGQSSFADERIVQICEDLWPGDDAEKARWLALINADRAQNVQVREVWERLAKSVAAVVLAVAVGGVPTPAEASFKTDELCIMRNRRGRRSPGRAARHGNTIAASAAA